MGSIAHLKGVGIWKKRTFPFDLLGGCWLSRWLHRVAFYFTPCSHVLQSPVTPILVPSGHNCVVPWHACIAGMVDRLQQ